MLFAAFRDTANTKTYNSKQQEKSKQHRNDTKTHH